MGLLFLVVVIVFIYWTSQKSRNENQNQKHGGTVDDLLSERNSQWAQFIYSYTKVAKTKSAKELIARMLSDIEAQGLAGSKVWNLEQKPTGDEHLPSPQLSAAASTPPTDTATVDSGNWSPKNQHNVKLDNASLLLYFGAFLFVASVGLFIGFAGVNGELRTLAVAVMSLVFYIGGVWLFRNKKALQPAGLAFTAIGIAVAPLIGVAAYSFIWKGSPEAVWFATSIFCLGLYAHALTALKKPLINYIFIFTILSLFESAISIIDAPIYYFGWVMAFVGILTLLISRISSLWPEFKESSHVSGQLFVPLSVLAAFVIAPAEGLGQLGVSLLLAAFYYGVEAYSSEGADRARNFTVSHMSLLSAVICLSYAATNNLIAISSALLVMNVVHTVLVYLIPKDTPIAHNFIPVLVTNLLVALFFSVNSPGFLVVVLFSSVVTGFLAWLRQQRVGAYLLSSAALIALPLAVGHLYLEPQLSPQVIAYFLLAAWFMQAITYILTVSNTGRDAAVSAVRFALLFSAGVVFIFAVAASPAAALIISLIMASGILALSEMDKGFNWEVTAGIFAALPIIVSINSANLLLTSMVVALLFNIGLALKYRSEANRWLSALIWLLLPLGFGAAFGGWSAATYAWSYMVVMAGLLFSRAIARGSVFVSNKIPMAAYAKTASLSYVYGYVTAACLAVLISLASVNSQLHTSLILAVLSAVAFALSYSIERKKELLALLPLLLQAVLLSVMRPSYGQSTIEIYLIISSLLTVGLYLIARLGSSAAQAPREKLILMQATIASALIVPLSWLIIGESLWPMPVGLFLFSGLLLDYFADAEQDNREAAVGISVLAVMWLLYIIGLRELQIYTHIIAVMFAGFAYWRHIRRETEKSDGYLVAMLSVATIPLLLQALSSESGGVYGWWLLLEQVFFMLLGMSISRSLVTKWGLYVGVGAVLYQLRNLGFAALALLALFIIGIAIYQLQKYNQDPPKE